MALESAVHCLNFEAGCFFMDRMPFLSSNLPNDSSRGRTAGHSLTSYPRHRLLVLALNYHVMILANSHLGFGIPQAVTLN